MALDTQDIKKLQEVLATKEDINAVRVDVAGLKTDVAGLATNISGIRADIKSIHTDLIKHDERAEEMLKQILAFQTLESRVERISRVLREKLGAEV